MKNIVNLIVLLLVQIGFTQNGLIQNKCSLWLKNDSTSVGGKLINFNSKVESNVFEYKNILKKEFSLFVVFKSDPKEIKNIITLNYGRHKFIISNKDIKKNNELISELNNPSSYKLVSFIYKDNSLPLKNKLIFDILSKKSKDELLEFILIPKVINKKDREIIETHLSIKYGISLNTKSPYISFTNDTIWNSTKNNIFINNVTGIGRDIKNNFNQVKSINSNEGDLQIEAINGLNTGEYFIFGDNKKSNKVPSVKEIQNNVTSFKLWKINHKKSDVSTTKLKLTFNNVDHYLDKEHLGKNEEFVLFVSNSNNDKLDLFSGKYYYSPSSDGTILSFDNVEIEEESIFVIVKAPKLFFTVRSESTCFVKQSKLTLKIESQNFPVNLTLKLDNKIVKEILVSNANSEIDNLTNGEYELIISDKNNNFFTEKISINSPRLDVLVKENYSLNENESVEIKPEINSPNNDLKFEWTNADGILSNEKNLLVNKEGNYNLKITTKEDCSKSFDVNVTKFDDANSVIKLYPNPVLLGQEFTINLNTKENASYDIFIYDNMGKLISQESTHQQYYKKRLFTSGVYYVKVKSINSENEFKLIVK